MAFSPTHAALEGFRLIRRGPWLILWWSLAYLIFMAVLIAAVGGPLLSLMPQLMALDGQSPESIDFAPILRLYGIVLVIALPLGLVGGSVLNAAVARSIIRPDERSFGYLRIGMDEVRVTVVSVLLGLVILAVYAGLGGLVAGLAFGGYQVHPALGIIVGVFGAFGVVSLLVWLGVRLSLALPVVVAERRIVLFESWRLTRGRFWPLLGMALLACVLGMVVSMLGSIVSMPFQIMGGTGLNQAIEAGDMTAVMAAVGPFVIVSLIANLIVSALQLAVMYAPFASAYLDIKGRPDIADTFGDAPVAPPSTY